MTQRQERQLKKLISTLERMSDDEKFKMRLLRQQKSELEQQQQKNTARQKELAEITPSPFDTGFLLRIREGLLLNAENLEFQKSEIDFSIESQRVKLTEHLRAETVLKSIAKNR